MKLLLLLLVLLNDLKLGIVCSGKFVLKGAVSDFFPRPKFLSRRSELAYFLVYLFDTYFPDTQHTNNLKVKHRLKKDFAARLEAEVKPTVSPIPTYAKEEITPAEVERLLAKKEPFIIKGYFSEARAVREWAVDSFLEKYGDVPVLCGDPDINIHPFQPLKVIREDGAYARNVESLFLRDQSLVTDLELERLGDYHFDRNGWFHSMQLFIANSTKARSGYHCAKMDNFFIMVHGEKKWWFVNPLYTHAMEPFFNKRMGYFESKVGNPEEPDPEVDLYPRVPRLEGVVESGDLLYSPPLWWHAISNATHANIAVSTRWYSADVETYYPLSLLQVLCLRFMWIKLTFAGEIKEHIKRFGWGVNFHKDRNYVSCYDEKTKHTLFETASHQQDFQDSLRPKSMPARPDA